MGSDTFLGLGTVAWAAIGTIGLVLVTGAYVVLTGFLAKSSSNASKAAMRSAAMAERSAQAAERAARLTEAGLDLGFTVEFVSIPENTPSEWVEVKSTGARVFLHSVELFVHYTSNGELKLGWAMLDPLHPVKLPVSLRREDTVIFEWPGDVVDSGSSNGGIVTIRFTTTAEDESDVQRMERSLEFP